MNQVLRIIGVAALLLAGLTTNAQAAGRGLKAKGEAPKAGKPMGPLADLNLTPEQKQKMDQIHEAAAKQAEPLHKELGAKMKEMQALWTVDKPDKAAIERKHGEMNAVNSKLWGIHIDAKLQIHALLTPEQRAKWSSRPGMGPGMHGMHGPGMVGMPGPGMCPHMAAGDCPCPHSGECPRAKAGDCPCMHGGPGKGPGAPPAGGPGAPAAPPTAPTPEKK
jgi:Spy/CpxP family protein refolding chaperone